MADTQKTTQVAKGSKQIRKTPRKSGAPIRYSPVQLLKYSNSFSLDCGSELLFSVSEGEDSLPL